MGLGVAGLLCVIIVAVVIVFSPPRSSDAPSASAEETTPSLGTPTTKPAANPIPQPVNQYGSFNYPVAIRSGYRFPGLGTLSVVQSAYASGQTGLAIVVLSFVCERPAGQICDTGDFMLDTVGSSGNGYSRVFESGVPEPSFGSFDLPDLYGGGKETGYAAFQITKPENRLLLTVKIFLQDGIIYFALN